MSKSKESTKRRAQRTTSNIFAMFSQNQIAEFKEAFQFIDSDKDGLISKNDLRQTFDALGRIVPDGELEGMLKEAPGPINFTMFLSVFGDRIGGGDNFDVIKAAFKSFDEDESGMCKEADLRKMICKFGEKLTEEEFDMAMSEAKVNVKGEFNIDQYVKLLTGSAAEEEAQ